MHTNFSPEQLSQPALERSNVELSACLQCGYCMSSCPTYQISGDEFDSPRGRIKLIGDMLESGTTPDAKTVKHLDGCLTCLACMSSCPSSVHYLHLVDHARGYIEKNYRRPMADRFLRWLLAQTLSSPERLRLAMRGAKLAKPFAFALPEKFRNMVLSAPAQLPPASINDQSQIFHAIGRRKQRVALMTGCAQKVLNTDINDATIRILRRHGCDVVVAQGTDCCGALNHHMGKSSAALEAGARNIRAWMREVEGPGLDAIVINTSGCGTVVKDYGHMFVDHELSSQAATISALAKDIAEVLSDLELDHKTAPGLRVAYHATCSLQFGQRIRFTPKKLLKQAGFTVLESKDSHVCCGSAGTYSLLQPENSNLLKERKVKNLERTAPDLIAAGNIGCMVQIGSGTNLPVVHTVELLDWVTGGPKPPALSGTALSGPTLSGIAKEAVAAHAPQALNPALKPRINA